ALLTNASFVLALLPARRAQAEEPASLPRSVDDVASSEQSTGTVQASPDGHARIQAGAMDPTRGSAAAREKIDDEHADLHEAPSGGAWVDGKRAGGAWGRARSGDESPPVPSSSAPAIRTLALPTGEAKASVSNQTIALPSGSATVQGMGESFS